MHIPHENALGIVANTLAHTFFHSAGRTVGEGQAEHILEGDAVILMRVCDAFRQDFGFAAAGRSQHQKVSAARLNCSFLFLINDFFHNVDFYVQNGRKYVIFN